VGFAQNPGPYRLRLLVYLVKVIGYVSAPGVDPRGQGGPKQGLESIYSRNRLQLLFYEIYQSCIKVEAVDFLQTLFRAPYPWFRVKARSRRSRLDQVDYWEGVPHILYIKSCLKILDHGSRSTWSPGPSRSGFWAQKI
jgi:hypothetical protein